MNERRDSGNSGSSDIHATPSIQQPSCTSFFDEVAELRAAIQHEKQMRLKAEALPVISSDLQSEAADREAKLKNEIRKLRRRLMDVSRRHEALVNSRSWRMTAPYRSAGLMLKSLFRRNGGARYLAQNMEAGFKAKPVSEFARKAIPSGLKQALQCDVCIITNCRFPGGNASSTLDEVRTFSEAGLQVALVHCPLNGKIKPISERYATWLEHIVHIEDLSSIDCNLLIIRGPRVIMEESLKAIGPIVKSKRTAFVINNSAFRPDGALVFGWRELLDRVDSLPWENKAIHPLGPAIRHEVREEALSEAVSPHDWPPTFDAGAIPFIERGPMVMPFVIGRHGRDGHEKWLESSDELLKAYPSNPSVQVRIMGGAEKAERLLGVIPENWMVLPFGAQSVADFLQGLDAFVYFPHTGLNEAFGRTIVEAMFSGLPCILPRRFATTFGELAVYCEPSQVMGALERLASDDIKRKDFVRAVREQAFARYESASLFLRAPELPVKSEIPQPEPLNEELLRYKAWVEGV
ncbi:glycosyltransferase [Aquamicrobium ahrensii]|uniref:Glycosyltransferase involved in cell wall biosynthesis n=1 Tax=Aquamicrobium ahrensii TaxID=469551 RepID=A0ABV2KHH9_9HYPH